MTTADSDGDGSWDGWLGVYGVNRSKDVVLYREHLQTGDGIEGREIVSEQVGVYRLSANTSTTGAELFNNVTEYHSNVHVGELRWGHDSSNGADTPDPSLSIEVDFYQGAAVDELDTPSWERGIEENLALYGIELDVIRDQTLSDPLTVYRSVFGFSIDDLFIVRAAHKNTGADEYVLIAHRPGPEFWFTETVTGWNNPFGSEQMLFTEDIRSHARAVPDGVVTDQPYNTSLAVAAAHVQIHEVGHSYQAGKNDDDFIKAPLRLGEVYSGNSNDDTPERYQIGGATDWSVMRSGWEGDLIFRTGDRTYYVFSLEELVTVDDP